MSPAPCLCRTATTFAADGAFEEDAQAQFLERLVERDIGLYLGSGGSGEGHALTRQEFRRLLLVGTEVGRGKVPVNANPPEQYTIDATLELARIAIECRVDVINIYSPAGLHGYRASDEEVLSFYDRVLSEIKYPVALGPGPVIGYSPKAETIATVCNRYPQVVAVNLAGLGDTYFVDLQHALRRHVDIYVPFTGSLNMLALGAAGILGPEANIIPRTFRRYMDFIDAGNSAAPDQSYAEMKRLTSFVRPWHSGSPRWLKLAMRALNLSGAHLRLPYIMPDEAEIERFARGLFALGLAEFTTN